MRPKVTDYSQRYPRDYSQQLLIVYKSAPPKTVSFQDDLLKVYSKPTNVRVIEMPRYRRAS